MGVFGIAKRGLGMLGKKKTSRTISSVKPGKNLTEKFKKKQEIFKTVDKAGPRLSPAQKGKFKREGAAEVDKIMKKYGK
tara:strand:- start:1256 stop:1492 length:237 start_codon:yes stop_codon:yes gene_type:complete